jgi:hypothetical protein
MMKICPRCAGTFAGGSFLRMRGQQPLTTCRPKTAAYFRSRHGGLADLSSGGRWAAALRVSDRRLGGSSCASVGQSGGPSRGLIAGGWRAFFAEACRGATHGAPRQRGTRVRLRRRRSPVEKLAAARRGLRWLTLSSPNPLAFLHFDSRLGVAVARDLKNRFRWLFHRLPAPKSTAVIRPALTKYWDRCRQALLFIAKEKSLVCSA